jgi:hypothetical protein
LIEDEGLTDKRKPRFCRHLACPGPVAAKWPETLGFGLFS